jgi:hypothetical protein
MFVQFEGAHLRDRSRQGGYIDWWVVIVRRSVLNAPSEREKVRDAFEAHFEQPVVLMAQQARGVPTY